MSLAYLEGWFDPFLNVDYWRSKDEKAKSTSRERTLPGFPVFSNLRNLDIRKKFFQFIENCILVLITKIIIRLLRNAWILMAFEVSWWYTNLGFRLRVDHRFELPKSKWIHWISRVRRPVHYTVRLIWNVECSVDGVVEGFLNPISARPTSLFHLATNHSEALNENYSQKNLDMSSSAMEVDGSHIDEGLYSRQLWVLRSILMDVAWLITAI